MTRWQKLFTWSSVHTANRQGSEWTPLNQKNYQSLLTAMFFVLVPHLFYLPFALSGLMLITLSVWQYLIFKHGHYQKIQKPFWQYSCVILGLMLIYVQYRTLLGVEAGNSILALILLGKMFEVKHYRDAIVQFNFGLFVAAVTFLHGQQIGLAVAVLIAIFGCLYGMYQLQNYHAAFEDVSKQSVTPKALRHQTFRDITKLMLYATPLMVVLFLFVPRFPPLWNIPLPNNRHTTGMSDHVAPGDIAQLSQSSALAFRAIFDEPQHIPQPSQLYWRAMTLEHFDGVQWTQDAHSKYRSYFINATPQLSATQLPIQLPAWFKLKSAQSQFIHYQLWVEPTQQKWLFALDYSIASQPLLLNADMSIQTSHDIYQRQLFDFQLIIPQPYADVMLDQSSRQRNLQLPINANPISFQFAQALFERSHRDPVRYSQAILAWIRQEQFSYTLSPPPLQQQRIDDFLFRTKAGFCEHYASAFVNLMRMAGIPARLVVGYQGGKAAPDGKTWEVRQLDAHAWAEIWLDGRGWVRVDPTAAIAPQRVNLGMQDFSAQNSTLFGTGSFSAGHTHWLTQARIWADYANYQWQGKIVGFDQNKQHLWFKKLALHNLSTQIIAFMVLMASVIGLMLWSLMRSQRKSFDAVDVAVQRLSRKFKIFQLQRHINEPILTWLQRLEARHPYPEFYVIKDLLIRHYYIASLDAQEIKLLNRLIRKYSNMT